MFNQFFLWFLQVLKEELEKNHLLPKRYDWEGQKYDQTFDQLVSFKHFKFLRRLM